MVIDELDSANNFPERGDVEVTADERAQQDQSDGSNVALRRLLKAKGVPMIGSSWPAYHPDFFVSMTQRGTTQVYRWVRRTSINEGTTP